MQTQTKGSVERGILCALLNQRMMRRRFQYGRDILATSTVEMRINKDIGSEFRTEEVSSSSIRRALTNLRGKGLVENPPDDEIEEEERQRHIREKFWRVTPEGFAEALKLHQMYNRELAKLHRRFGSSDWHDDPGLGMDFGNMGGLDYRELQQLAKSFPEVDGNQSERKLREELSEKFEPE